MEIPEVGWGSKVKVPSVGGVGGGGRREGYFLKYTFENFGFLGERKTGVPGEKPLGVKKRTNNKLNPQIVSKLGFEPGSHWWGANALNAAPSLVLKRPYSRALAKHCLTLAIFFQFIYSPR